MKKRIVITLLSIIFLGIVTGFYIKKNPRTFHDQYIPSTNTPTIAFSPTSTIQLHQPPAIKIIPQKIQVFQSFNNCGPASLSMLLSYFNTNISQETIGQQLRPYQNLQGNNDDKSVTLPELERFAQQQHFLTYHRPNGSLEKAKLLIANDIPFIVRTWLNPNEDIGHYRVVRGYDDTTQEFIQDDSYQGGNVRYSYNEFMNMWQPFNYEFLVIIPEDKKEIVEAILQEDVSWEISWQHALENAQQEAIANPENLYAVFNQSVANYHLGNYEESVQTYEEVVSQLPPRMLWYQIEPIEAYLEIGNYDIVFSLTNSILNNQNRAFSELYIVRGKAYEKQGNIDLARQEYEKAVLYNQYLPEAQNALQRLEN
ncbi:MAG TPA: C39 family peptidase [Candidatus Woesebacteria bacterium]|nr:C39 family peptidase [Candidatus Woesebacteria bacterium]